MDNESLEALRGELFPRKGFYQEKQEIGDSGDARDIEKLDKKRKTYVRNAAAGEVLTEGIYGKHIKCLRLDIIDESWYDISKHIDGALEFHRRG
ncbi:hypothetical protein EMCRGX_G022281 [Ephydatia muelleri]